MVSNHLILDGLDGLRWFRKNVRFLMQMVSKKGKQRALSHAHKSGEDSDSESDFPDVLITQGMYLYPTCAII